MMQTNWTALSQLMDDLIDAPSESRRALVEERTGADASLRLAALRFLAGLEAGPGSPLSTAVAAPSAARPAPLQPGDRIGAWQVEGSIGAGGMGRVYHVTRVEGGFTQDAALKLVDMPYGADGHLFGRERQTLADLDHPSIARILDGGTDPEGRVFMVMERIVGDTLDRWCAVHKVDLPGRVRLVLAAAEGLARAHGRLVLHRDLKPSNIMVDASGAVRLIDFGIARPLESDAAEPIGPLTLAYAAPEMLMGGPVGPSADVYGLARVLADLVQGPSQQGSLPAALGVVTRRTEPVALTAGTLLPDLRRSGRDGLVADLAAVLACATALDPLRRYQTMEAFAADLDHALSGHGVKVRAGEPGYRFRRWCWRFRVPLAAAATGVASLAAGLGLALWQAGEARAARDAAVVEAARSEAVRQSVFLILGEATEAAGPEGSRKDVLDRASARLSREFSRDPARYAPLLKALGELYFHSGDYLGAVGLLTPVAELSLASDAGGAVAPAVIAEAKIDLAQVLMRTGQPQAARDLMQAAQGFWSREPARWRTNLIDSRLVEAQILRDLDKDPAAAALLLREALEERIAVSGPTNRDVAIFQNNLGNILFGLGDHAQAAEAFRQATATWKAIGATETPDAMNTANNLAVTELLLGRPEAAAPMFAEAVRLRRELFGPSAALAALINNSAKALLQQGDATAALPLAEEAASMARSFAGEGSMLHAAAAAGLSEALIGVNRGDDALDVAELALSGAQQASGAGSPPATVALIAVIRALAASGQIRAAEARLSEAEAGVAAMGQAGNRLGAGLNELIERYRLERQVP